ncbi:hypothetical protein LJK88_01125 [Paenibacillus sp. P26]|nr:hypothetical protein LJK88_01125 [Paenibacillus sp. P26]
MKKKALLLLTASIGLGVLIWELFDGYERIAVNKVYDNTQTELTASAAALSSAVNRRVAPLQGLLPMWKIRIRLARASTAILTHCSKTSPA